MPSQANNGKASKYLFNDRDFSDQAIEAEIEAKKNAPPPPPMFTQQQLADARQAGFKEGFQQGSQEQKQAREAHLTHVFDEIKRQLDIVITAETVRGARFEKDALDLSMAIVRHIYPQLTALCAEDQLIEDLKRIIEHNRDQDSIAMSVHPEMVELVQKRFQNIDNIDIKSDPSLGVSDANLGWPNGGVVIKRDQMLEAIDTIIDGLLGGREALAPMSPQGAEPDLVVKEPDGLEEENDPERADHRDISDTDTKSDPKDTGE